MQNFEVICKLGDGAFSQVYKVKRKKDGKMYAMKKVKIGALGEKEKENALNEVRILASIRHPNIISWKDTFLDGQILCIIMELADGGDLMSIIKSHQKTRTTAQEDDLWNWSIQIILGVKALHDMQILHRDLKCANVFINKQGVIKIGDLNVSKVAKKQLAYTQTGTPYYASPEVWKDQPYDSKSDIWSLGCVIYELASLQPPFRANDLKGLYKAVLRGVYDPLPSKYSQDFKDFVKIMLNVNPSQRPSCDKLLSLSSVQMRMGNLRVVPVISKTNYNNQLLGTIKVPKNLVLLADRLPSPNYEDPPKDTPKLNKHEPQQDLKIKEIQKVKQVNQNQQWNQQDQIKLNQHNHIDQDNMQRQYKLLKRQENQPRQNQEQYMKLQPNQAQYQKYQNPPERNIYSREIQNQREVFSQENNRVNLQKQQNSPYSREIDSRQQEKKQNDFMQYQQYQNLYQKQDSHQQQARDIQSNILQRDFDYKERQNQKQEHLLAKYRPSAQYNAQQLYNPTNNLQQLIQQDLAQQNRLNSREKQQMQPSSILERPSSRDQNHLSRAAREIVSKPQTPLLNNQIGNKQQNPKDIMTPERRQVDYRNNFGVYPDFSPNRVVLSREREINQNINNQYIEKLQLLYKPNQYNPLQIKQQDSKYQKSPLNQYQGGDQILNQIQPKNVLQNNIYRLNNMTPNRMPYDKIQPTKALDYAYIAAAPQNRQLDYLRPQNEIKNVYNNQAQYNYLIDNKIKVTPAQPKRVQSVQTRRPEW